MKEYFSHDYNARNDTKLVKVFMKYDLKGLGAYWCIIEMLYEEGGYLLRSEYERISFELRVESEFIKSIVEDFDLFKKDSKKFWSETALDRLKKRIDKSAKARESVQKRWEKHKSNTNVEQSKNDSNTSKEKESKKKDIKERENDFKNKILSYQNEYNIDLLNYFFNYWSQHGENDKKMLFEKQRSFEIKKRLQTWKKNESKFKGEKGGFQNNQTGNAASKKTILPSGNIQTEWSK